MDNLIYLKKKNDNILFRKRTLHQQYAIVSLEIKYWRKSNFKEEEDDHDDPPDRPIKAYSWIFQILTCQTNVSLNFHGTTSRLE